MPKGKASPSKPALPKKPPRPRPVQDEAVNAVRQWNWQLAMDEWDEKIKAHDAAMYAREASKKRDVRAFWAHNQPSTKAAARPQSKQPTAASLASPRRSPRHSTVPSSSSDDQALPLSSSAPGAMALVASSSTAAAPSRSHPPATQALSDAVLSVEPRLLERQRDHPVRFGNFALGSDVRFGNCKYDGRYTKMERLINVSDAYRRGESDCLCDPDCLPKPPSDCRCGRITAARLAAQVRRPSNPKP